jgi:hypothetical protein
MHNSTKRLFTILLPGILCLHFFLVVMYCNPVKPEPSKLTGLTKLYIYPIFHQNWGLFVPAPDVRRRLFVRYDNGNGFTGWEDILENEIYERRRNPWSGNDARVLLFSNSLIYELNLLDGKPSQILEGQTNMEFIVLQFEVNQYLKLKHVKKQAAFEMLLASSGKESKAYYIPNLTVN